MKCKNCGSLLNDNDLFCTNCGIKIEPQNDTNILEPEEVLTQSVVEMPTDESVIEKIPVEKKQKKPKNKLVIIIITIVVLLILLFGVFYFYEFKTANTRVNSLLNKMFSFTETNINMTKKQSGSYSIDGTIESNGESAKVAVDGTYGLDAENEILNLGLKLKEISSENKNILDKDVNLSLAVNSNILGVYSKELYSKYITVKDESFKEIFKSLEENNGSMVLVNELLNSLKLGINKMSKTQSIKTIEYNGKKAKLNVVKIEFTKNNTIAFGSEMLTYLKNSDKFIEEYSKINSLEKEEVKSAIEENINSLKDQAKDTNTVLEIGTTPLKGDFEVIKLYNTKEEGTFELFKINDGFKFVADIDEVLLNLELTSKKTKSDKTNDVASKIVLNIDNSGEKYNMTFNIEVKEDKEPTVDKINMKNSISYDKLTDADIEKIYNNFAKLGFSNALLPSETNSAESNALIYIDAVETTLMKQALSSSKNYDGTYKLDSSNTLILKGNNTIKIDEDVKPDFDINSSVVIKSNIVTEAKLKYGEYYVLYKYDGKEAYYCSQKASYPIACIESTNN